MTARLSVGRATWLITAILLAVWAPPAGAGEDAAGNATRGIAPCLATLNSYLVAAADNNAELRAAFDEWRAAQQTAPQASSLPDPRLTYGYYIQPVETRTGPQRQRFGLSQGFPWFGTLSAKEREAVLKADARRARFESLRLKVFRDVKDAYYEYAYLAQAIGVTEENIELTRYLEEVVTARYKANLTPYSEVIKLQVSLGKLEDRLASLKDLRSPVAARLNAAMNRPVTQPVPLPEEIPVMTTSMTDKELLQGILEKNPALDEYRALAKASEARREAAELNYYPGFAVGVETILQDSARDGDPINNGENPLVATLSVNLPIWQEPRDAAVRQAELDKSAWRQRMISAGDSLSRSMQLALYGYRDAGRRMELYHDALLPKAEQGLGATLEAFQAGEASALDLVDAERSLLEFELAYLRALADQAQRMAEMEAILGEEIPCDVHGAALDTSRTSGRDRSVRPKDKP